MSELLEEAEETGFTRYESLPKPVKILSLVLYLSGLGFFIYYVFGFIAFGWVLDPIKYYYILYITFGTQVFIVMPMRKKDRNRLPWYDVIFAALVFGSCLSFSLHSLTIMAGHWVPPDSTLYLVLATVVALLAVEGGRRMAGWVFAVICLVFGIYPLFAEFMPGILYGFSLSFPKLVASFAFGTSGMLGIPARVMGEILIGFLVFAGILQSTGAGKFFIDLAQGLLGRYRGGPAKVAVVASGFFGSLSGSPTANVVSTGAFTIPAMKRLGYPAYYAGAVEAVASTGGPIMPPVMGSIAFIMAVLTDIPYATIIVAAIIPAILYYYGLLIQVDAYAAKNGIKGTPPEEIPSMVKTLKKGWPFLVVLVFLTFGLVYMRWGVIAPLYASALLLVLSFFNRSNMITPRKALMILANVGNLITYVMAVLLPVGLLLLGMTVTGSLTALTQTIISAGNINPYLLLFLSAVLCFILGMVNIAAIPYIVLAVTVVPALAQTTGMPIIGLHLFLVYFLLVANITPPVAISAFVAAAVAKAPPMKTAWTATRLACVLYFIPFFFVFNPALLLQGPIAYSILYFALALLGIWILGSGLEGYMIGLGKLRVWVRVLFIVAGGLFAFPEWKTTIIGAMLAIIVGAIYLKTRRAELRKLAHE
jgi:TRAP transporter 4TM/12TM fusion protein